MKPFSEMNGQEDLVETPFVLVAGQWTKIASADPARWSIAFSLPTASATITTVSGGAGFINQGILVQPATSPVVLVYRDWGEFVKGEFWAKPSAAGSTLTVWTCRLRN